MRDRLLQSRVRVRLIERTNERQQQPAATQRQQATVRLLYLYLRASGSLAHTSFPPATSASGDYIVCSLRNCSQPSLLHSVRLSPKSQLRPTLAQRRCRRDAVSLALVFRPEYCNNSRYADIRATVARSLPPTVNLIQFPSSFWGLLIARQCHYKPAANTRLVTSPA